MSLRLPSFPSCLSLVLVGACATSSAPPPQSPPAQGADDAPPDEPPPGERRWSELEPFEVIEVKADVCEAILVLRNKEHMNTSLVTEDGIVVLDPMNPEAGAELARVLKERFPDKKLAAIVYSHYHLDHAGGAAQLLEAYGEEVPIIAHTKTAEILAGKEDKMWDVVVTPTRLIEPPHSERFGDITLELRYLGPNHTSDMLEMVVPEEKLAYLVDFVANDGVGYRDLPGFWLPQYWDHLDEVLRWDVEKVTFGHGFPGDKGDVREQKEYWEALRVKVREALDDGKSEDEAAAEIELPDYAHWRAYDRWFALNVRAVYRYEKKARADVGDEAPAEPDPDVVADEEKEPR